MAGTSAKAPKIATMGSVDRSSDASSPGARGRGPPALPSDAADPDATGPFPPPRSDAAAPGGRAEGDPFAAVRHLRRVDRFAILEVLGEGGEGIVFAAYDPRLDRRVALKILPRRGDAPSADVALREARAMARLADPNVLSVYDAGMVDGAVYVVLEYVRGRTLATVLREEDLSAAQVLALYREAGRGLAAAHRAGVVHGDFKPGNVLVGDDGRVRVMDFGLARLAGADERHLSRFGTLAYMAPERLRGMPGTAASDQFSFCVALFEGLFGARPFEWGSFEELVEATTAGRVRLPSGAPRVPRRVRRAVLRGLSPEPADRFPTMEALLARLGRFALGRRGVATIVAGTAIVAGVAGYGAHQSAAEDLCRTRAARLARVWEPSRRAAVLRAFTEADPDLAQTTMGVLDAALSRYARRWGDAAYETCREQGRDDGEDKAASLVRSYCLERNARAFEAFVDTLQDGGRTALLRAAEGAASLPAPDECDRAAFEFDARSADPERAAALRARLDEALGRQLAGDYEGGVALARTVVRGAEGTGRTDLVAEARLRLGMLEHYAGDYAEAARDLAEAAFVADAAGADRTLALARTVLVHVEGRHLAHYEAAHTWLRHARAAVARAGADDTDVAARLLLYEAMLARDQGDLAGARRNLEHARVLRVSLFGDPSLEVAEVDAELGRVYEDAGDIARALDHARRAYEAYAGVLGDTHPELAPKQHEIGRLLARAGRPREGLSWLAKARAGYERLRADGYPDLGRVLADEARVLATLGRTDRALARFEEAARRLDTAFGPGGPAAAAVRVDHAQVLADLGRVAAAAELLETALPVLVEALPPDHRDRVRAEALAARLRGGSNVRTGPPVRSASLGPSG